MSKIELPKGTEKVTVITDVIVTTERGEVYKYDIYSEEGNGPAAEIKLSPSFLEITFSNGVDLIPLSKIERLSITTEEEVRKALVVPHETKASKEETEEPSA